MGARRKKCRKPESPLKSSDGKSEIKNTSLRKCVTYIMVTRTGFEPVNACVKGK